MNPNDILINVQVNGVNQLTALSNAMRAVNTNLADSVRTVHNLDARARALSQAIGRTSSGMNDHAKSIQQVITNQTALGSEIRRSKSDFSAMSKQLGVYSQANKQAAKDLRNYSEALKGVKARALVADLRSVSNEIKRLGKDAQFTGRSMIIGITTPIMAFAQVGLSSFLSLDKEMVRLNKLIDNMASSVENAIMKIGLQGEAAAAALANPTQQIIDMVSEYNRIEKAIISISREFGTAKELVAGITGDFAELGLYSNDSALGLTRLSMAAEKLGNLDIGPSSELVLSVYSQASTLIQENALARGKLISAVDAEAKAVKVARGQLYLFNAVENSTALSLRDIAQAFPEVAAAASQFGLSMTEAAAFLAPMKAAGFEIGASANSIKVSLQRLNDPTVKSTERMKALTKATGYDFEKASSIGITAIDALAIGYEKLARETAYGKEGVQEFFNTLFESRQGPRMSVLIENLAIFNKELQQNGLMANTIATKINSMNQAMGGTLPVVKTFSDLSAIARISAKEVGDTVEYLDEFNQKVTFKITSEAKKNATNIRASIGDFIEESRKNNKDIINEISSQAGRALIIQFAGPEAAAARAQQELNTALNSISAQIQKLKNDFKIIASELISNLRPALETAAKILSFITDRIKNLSPGIKQLILGFMALAAALGPLVFAFGQARLAIATLGNFLLKPLPGLSYLTYESIAAAPALLNLRKPAILLNGTIETSASRFSILIAKIASLESPIGRMAQKFGILTGSLRKTRTASEELVSSVNMIKGVGITGTGSAAKLKSMGGIAGISSLPEPEYKTPLPTKTIIPEYKLPYGFPEADEVADMRRDFDDMMRKQRARAGVKARRILGIEIDKATGELVDKTTKRIITPIRKNQYNKLLTILNDADTQLSALMKKRQLHFDKQGRMFHYDTKTKVAKMLSKEQAADIVKLASDAQAKTLADLMSFEDAIEMQKQNKADIAAAEKKYKGQLKRAMKKRARELAVTGPTGMGLKQFDAFVKAETAAGKIDPSLLVKGAKPKLQERMVERIYTGRSRGIDYASGAAMYKKVSVGTRAENMILAGGLQERLAKIYLANKRAFDVFFKLSKGIAKGIGKGIAGGFKLIGKAISMSVSGLTTVITTIGKPLISAGMMMGRYIKFFGGYITSSIGSLLSTISTGFASVSRALSVGASYITRGYRNITSPVKQSVQRFTRIFKSTWITEMNEFGVEVRRRINFFQKISRPIQSGFNSILPSVTGSIKRFGSIFKTTWTATMSEGDAGPTYIKSTFFTRLGSRIASGFSYVGNSAVRGIKLATAPIKLALLKLGDPFFNFRIDPTMAVLSMRDFIRAIHPSNWFDYLKAGFAGLNNLVKAGVRSTVIPLMMSAKSFAISSKRYRDNAVQSLILLKSAIINGISSIGRGISQGFNSITSFFAAGATATGSVIKNSLSRLTNIFSTQMKVVTTPFGTGLVGMTFFDRMRSSITSGFNSIGSSVSSGFARLSSIFATQYKIVSGQFGPGVIKVTFFDRLKSSMASSLDSLKALITSGFGKVRTAMISSAGSIRSTYSKIGNAFTSASIYMHGMIMRGNAIVINAFNAFHDGLYRIFTSKIPAIYSYIITSITTFGTRLGTAYAGVVAKIIAGSRAVTAALSFSSIKTAFGTALSSMGGIIGKLSGLGTKLKDGLKKTGTGIASFDKFMSKENFVKQRFEKDAAGVMQPIDLEPGQEARGLTRRIAQKIKAKSYKVARTALGITPVTSGISAAKEARLEYITRPRTGGGDGSFLGKQVSGIKGFIKGMNGAMKVTKLLKFGLMGFGALAVFTAIIAGVSLFMRMFKKGGDQVNSVKENFVKAFGFISQAIKAIIKPIKDAIFTLVNMGSGEGGNALQNLSEKIKDISNKIRLFVLKYVVPIIRKVMTNVVDYIHGIVRVVKGFIELFKGNWKDGLKTILKGLAQFARAILNIIFMLLKGWVKVWKFTMQVLINLVFGVAKGIVSLIGGAIQKILEAMEKIPVVGKLFGIAGGAVGDFTNTINGALESIQGFAKDAVGSVANVADKGLSAVQGVVTGWLDDAIGSAQRKLDDSTGIDLFPGSAKSEGQETGEEFADGFGQGLDGMGDAAKGALDDLGQKFVDLVLGYVAEAMQKAVDDMTKVLEQQKEAALGAFDAQLEALEQLEKAEESLTKEMQYQSERRKMIQERELQMQNYQRNRALAIYEGRIDDARVLTLEEQKNSIEYTENLAKFDEDRRKDLASENLQAMKDAINKAKDEAGKFFDEQVEKFREAAALITEFPPVTIEEYQDQMNQLAETARTISGDNQSALSRMLNSLVTDIENVIPNKGIPAFSNGMNDLVNTAKSKYGFIEGDIEAITLTMLFNTGQLFRDDTNISTGFQEILNELKGNTQAAFNRITYGIISPSIRAIDDVLNKNNPITIFAEAVRRANLAIIADMKKMLRSVASEVKWLLPYLDKKVMSLAVLDALASAQSGDSGGNPLTEPMEGGAARSIKLYQQYGGRIPAYAYGGRNRSFIMGGYNKSYVVPGMTSTPVPAILHGGEYVVNAKAVNNIGYAALEALNNMRFAQPKTGTSALGGYSGGGQSMSTTNIYVENFIGEDEWFNSMIKQYNMNVLPKNQKSAGLESRVLSSYNGLARGR